MKFFLYIIIFGFIGLAVGYLIFARFNGHYIPINDLFFSDKGIVGSIGDALTGAEKIRRNIFIAGAVGAVVGLIAAAAGSKK